MRGYCVGQCERLKLTAVAHSRAIFHRGARQEGGKQWPLFYKVRSDERAAPAARLPRPVRARTPARLRVLVAGRERGAYYS